MTVLRKSSIYTVLLPKGGEVRLRQALADVKETIYASGFTRSGAFISYRANGDEHAAEIAKRVGGAYTLQTGLGVNLRVISTSGTDAVQ